MLPRQRTPAAAATSGPRTRPGFPQRALQAFYLATPLFALLDLTLGVNLRTTFLDDGPGLKPLYYVVTFGCGLAVTRWPARAAIIGLVESGTNIAWLVVGVALRYLSALDAALAEDATAALPFSAPDVLNLVLSALVLLVAYVGAQARLAGEQT